MKLITITTLLATTGLLLAQGSLTPPGAPASTMKTLDQIEPRTPLIASSPGVSINGSGTITISQSGSYYLTENLTVTSGDGILINAAGVTLDLNGFTISSTSATPAGTAIDIDSSSVSVFNGHILSGVTYDSGATGDQFTGSGFFNGISADSIFYENIRLQNLSVQGVDSQSIFCSNLNSTIVESCTVTVCGSTGIRAGLVKHCMVENAGLDGILAREVSFCYATSVGADGIDASYNVSNSTGVTTSTSSTSNGIEANGNVINSYGVSNGGDGIESTGNVSNSYGNTNGTGDGIFASFNVMNSYGLSDGDDGIDATYTISYSRGFTLGTGVGLECTIAIGCTSSGGESITNRYLMP
ncbi:MAG: hypothetical protein AAGC74_05560 [Verrucomicrobiota bacterium]